MTALPLTSRFQIVERPVAIPGKCVVCGATDRPCVDFGMDIDDYGAVYFCLDCMREGGLAAGLIHPEVYEKAKLGAEQSLNVYLHQRELRIVSDEFYRLLHNLVDSLPNAFPDTHVYLGLGDAESIDEEGSGVRQELLPIFDPSDPSIGQDDLSASDERPSRISASTGFGDLFDPLNG